MHELNKKRFGFIAQEVEHSFKDEKLGLHYILESSEDKKQYLSYLELISPLTKVVTGLVDKINGLEKRIKELENK
jgi:hypothetical protein